MAPVASLTPAASGKEASERERRADAKVGRVGAEFMSWLFEPRTEEAVGLVPGDGAHERKARYGSFCCAICYLDLVGGM